MSAVCPAAFDPVMLLLKTRGNYQRMEFLGDAILQLVTSDHVYKSFPAHHEGHLTVSAGEYLCPDGAGLRGSPGWCRFARLSEWPSYITNSWPGSPRNLPFLSTF